MAWFANLKVRTKLIFSLFPLGLIVLGALFFSSMEMERIDRRYSDLVEHRVKAIMAMTRSNQRIILINQELYELIAESDPDKVNRIDAEIEKTIREYQALLDEARRLDSREALRINNVGQLFDNFIVEAASVRAKAKLQADAQALELMRGRIRPLFIQARTSTAALADWMRDDLELESEKASADTAKTVRLTWMAVVAGLALSLAMALAISQRGVASPLHRLRDAIRAVASGNHGEAVPCREMDNEIGEIAKAMETLRQGAVERELQAFAKAQTAMAAEALQTAADYPAFASALFARLKTCLDVVHGELYLASGDGKRLNRVGGFALDDPDAAKSFALGEGLVGQCALDVSPIEASSSLDESGVNVRTGIGSLVPGHLLVAPLVVQARCIAVLEIACATTISTRGRMLLDAVMPVAALNLEILSGTLETRELLEKTRIQAESLAVSETQLIARKDELQAVLAEAESARNRLAEMTTSLPVGVYQLVCHPDGRRAFTFASPIMREVIGVDPEELMADPASVWRHVEPDDAENARQQVQSVLARAFAGESLSRGEIVLKLTFGGRERYVLTNAQYTPQKDGSVAASGFFQDVTERKKAEALMVDREVALEAARRAEQAQAELSAKLVEIERFNRLATGREERILELKKTLNEIAVKSGQPVPFPSLEELDRIEEQSLPAEETVDADAELSITKLLDFTGIQSLLEHFCQSVGVASAIIDLKGGILAAARWQRACTDFHRVCESSRARCMESDTQLSSHLQEGKEFTIYRCKNGMTDAASPIVIGGTHVANVFIGQFHSGPPDLEFFRAQARECGFDEDDYLAAVLAAPVIEESRLPDILGFLSGFARLVASLTLESHRAARAEADMERRAMELRQGQAAAMSLAEDAEQARVEIARYRDQLEQLVEERTGELRASEGALRQERYNLQNILDVSPVGVILSVDGSVRYANPRVSQIVEMRAGEPSPHAYVNPSDRMRITKELARHGVVRDMELRMYGPDKEIRDVLVTYLNCEYDGEQGNLGWMLDITERKKIENEVKRAQAEMTQIFNTAAGGMRVIGTDFTVRKVNDAYLELTGYTREEVIGQMCHDVFGGLACDTGDCPLRRIQAGEERVDVTIQKKRKDGSLVYCDLSVTPYRSPNGELLGVIEDFRDVTERMAAAQAMEDARRLAEEANKAKSDFLARMSHEIRTPMNAVIGMSHLALQTELTAKQHDYISKIQASANNLLGIINDILDFSKIEAGRMDIEHIPFDLDETLDNAASVIAVKAEEKGLEVIFDIARDVPRNLVGDPLRLTQVLINYANNAIKFTEKGHVLLSARLEKKLEDGRALIRFAVTDTGIGLTPEQIDRLFQSFSQADGSTTRKYGGTGLGLAICKRLAELMGGEVGVTSEPGRGSTFWFTVAAGVGEEPERRAAYVPAVDLRQMRCLVADDNPEMRRILADTLESFSFRVTAVADGAAALDELARAAKRDPFKLVLLDWKMPGLDGNEVARRIKNDPGLNVSQILMVTAFGREEVMREAADSGVSAFLVKPVGASTLFDTIMEVFGQQVERRVRCARKNAPGHAPLEGIKGARVLLAEDNEINQQVASEILHQAGLAVEIANTGREAVEKVERSGPGYFDAVLMDIQMPEMDGLEAAGRIRASNAPGARELPIIAMTAHAMAGDREKSLEAGMNDHVTKPINPEELFGALTRWIKPGERQAVAAPVDFVPEEDGLPLDGLPGLSVKLGLSRVGGNRKLYRQLAAKFAATNADAARAIRQSLDEGDDKTAARLAHTMKSVAGNIGAEELSRASGELERAVKAGEGQATLALLAGFSDLLDEVLASLASLESAAPAKAAPKTGQAFDPDAMRALLAELRELLETDLGQAMARAEALGGLAVPPGLKPELARLGQALSSFDTEEAAEAIDALLAALKTD